MLMLLITMWALSQRRRYLPSWHDKMVYAFFCQSVASTPCRLLYSAVYGDDMQTAVSEVSHVSSMGVPLSSTVHTEHSSGSAEGDTERTAHAGQ